MNATAVVTSHAAPDRLLAALQALHCQTVPPQQVVACVSDTPRSARLEARMLAGTVIVRRDLGDWGHDKRAAGLAAASGDWVWWVNDDDEYAPTFLEALMGGGGDIVGCDFRHKSGLHIEAAPQIGRVSSGSFIVRRQWARRVGWTGRDYEADGRFVQDVVAAGARWCRVPQTLYFHR